MGFVSNVDALRMTSAIGRRIRESTRRIADAENVSDFFRFLSLSL